MLAMYSGRQRRSARPHNLARCCGQEATNVGTNPSLWPVWGAGTSKSHQWTARRTPPAAARSDRHGRPRAASLGSPLDTVNTIDHRCDVDAQNGSTVLMSEDCHLGDREFAELVRNAPFKRFPKG